MKKPLAPKAKTLSATDLEIASLQHIAQAKKDAPKRTSKPEPEDVDKNLHSLAIKMANSEGAYDKALNAVYATFKDYAIAALPIIERTPAHTAALQDIRKVFGEARKPAAIQRVTMLNNMRKIAYGASETRGTAAQDAQGVQIVLDALEACKSMPVLKQALTKLKSIEHASTGVVKGVTVKAKVASSAPVKAADVVIPETRGEAIKAACRMLKFISETFLSAGSDSELVLEVADVIEHLQRKAA